MDLQRLIIVHWVLDNNAVLADMYIGKGLNIPDLTFSAA